jgi:hypothetical protein
MESSERKYRGRSRGHLPRGVRKCRAGYRAEVSVQGVLHNLGVYSTQGEAAAVYWREKGRIQPITKVEDLETSDSDSMEQLPLFIDPVSPQRSNAKWSVLEYRQLVKLVSQGTSIADIAVVLQRTKAGVLQRYVKLVQEGEGTFEGCELPTLIPPARYGASHVAKKVSPAVPRISKPKQGWWDRLWHGAVTTPKAPEALAVDTKLAAMHVELVALRAAHNNLLVQLGEEPTDVH